MQSPAKPQKIISANNSLASVGHRSQGSGKSLSQNETLSDFLDMPWIYDFVIKLSTSIFFLDGLLKTIFQIVSLIDTSNRQFAKSLYKQSLSGFQ